MHALMSTNKTRSVSDSKLSTTFTYKSSSLQYEHMTMTIIIIIIIITRKRAITKALQLEVHPDFTPVHLAYYQHLLGLFCSKILHFAKFRLATTNAGHVLLCGDT